MDNSTLREHVSSEAEGRVLEAVIEAGSERAAARYLDCHHSTVQKSMHRLRARLWATTAGEDAQPLSPQHPATSGRSPFHIWGVTTNVNGKGEVINQYIKTKIDPVVYETVLREAVQEFMAPVEGLDVPDAPTRDFDSDIVPFINIGDAHINMLARMEQTGLGFDLERGITELQAAIFQLIDELPYCERLVINDLGDATHVENIRGFTEASGYPLDFDRAYSTMIRAYSRVMRSVVEKALTKAHRVDVIINQGNHSRKNDLWMVELLTVAYSKSNRVTILPNDNPFIGYRVGKTLIMTNHSDKCPVNRLVGVMITDFRDDFGDTDFHYIWVGHVHHKTVVKEYPSVIVESFNNLAPNDAHHHDAGYRSQAAITMVYISREYGEVGRRVLSAKEVRDRLAALKPSNENYANLSGRRAFAA